MNFRPSGAAVIPEGKEIVTRLPLVNIGPREEKPKPQTPRRAPFAAIVRIPHETGNLNQNHPMKLQGSAYLPHNYRVRTTRNGQRWRYVLVSALTGIGEHRSSAIYPSERLAFDAGAQKRREVLLEMAAATAA